MNDRTDLQVPDAIKQLLRTMALKQMKGTPTLDTYEIELFEWMVSLREAWWTQPGLDGTLRVTTDPEYFELHSDSVELWSPGSPAFGERPPAGSFDAGPGGVTSLGELLDR